MGMTWDGFFKAPATGEYRFYISCDDPCELFMDKTNPLSSGVTPNLEEIANRDWADSWRRYFDPPNEGDTNQYISEWIPLEQDELYTIYAQHR